ncbi:hypothetical protein GCM10020367_33970 [Streptomyces sannanensis]|uniref:Uncharacterized protein n=1 Tax=Streptomyces sannanensis TaxID=285536 RepID=A0ABP6SD38_9ACTN
MRGGGALGADGHERFEGVSEVHSDSAAFLDFLLDGVKKLCEGGRGGNRAEPPWVIGLRVQQAQFDKAWGRRRLGLGYSSCVQRTGVNAPSLVTQLCMGMPDMTVRLIGSVCRHLFTPQLPECAGT